MKPKADYKNNNKYEVKNGRDAARLQPKPNKYNLREPCSEILSQAHCMYIIVSMW